MDNKPSQNPLVKQLQLLTTGWGYNFYNEKNQARADDLLIRQKATHYLGEATSSLAALEITYRQQFIPASTSENPFPPAAVLQRSKTIRQATEQIRERATRIRGASVPTQDKIWFRIRDEQTLLYQLLAHDEALIETCQQIADLARALSAPQCHADITAALAPVAALLATLDTTIRERADILALPTL